MHSRFLPLQGGIEQLTPEWFAQRKGRLTGSKLSNFCFIKTEEEYDNYYSVVFEGAPREPFSDQAKGYMQWGRDHEDVAICNFLDVAPKTLGDIYFAESPFFQAFRPHARSLPDGTYAIYGEDGTIVEEGVCEVKCPAAKKAPLCSFQVLLRASDVLGVRLLWAQECHCHLLGAAEHESLALVLVRFILENSLQYRHWFPQPCSL